MRLRIACASLAFLCSAFVATGQTPAPTCANLHIVPAVRECTSVAAIHVGEAGIMVLTNPNSEDRFLVEDLASVPGVRPG
jgi:hypothetical protein